MQVAPPKGTGGGGFVFEDKVCAWFLSHLLLREAPLGVDVGGLERIDFQTRPDGWFLDDLLLTHSAAGGPRRCALSVKSNTQFGTASAPADFVGTAWEQFLHEGSMVFDERTDFLGLVTAPLDSQLRDAVSFVTRTARDGDPSLLPQRYAQDGWASEIKRSLYRSFTCPDGLAQRHGVIDADIGRLLARLQFLEFDFESGVSESEKASVERCRRALRSQTLEDGASLWTMLLRLSAERRSAAGCLTRQKLLDELRTKFRLADLPHHSADWNRIERLSTNARAKIRDTIGGQVRIERENELTALAEALGSSTGAILVGRSGIGKSVVAKLYAERNLTNSGRCVWMDARSFDRLDYAAFEADLSLIHGLAEVLCCAPDTCPLLVLDGLDRSHDATPPVVDLAS